MFERPDNFRVETVFESADRTVAIVSFEGPGPKLRNKVSTMTYLVLAGAVNFSVENENGVMINSHLTADTSLTIPAGRVYQDQAMGNQPAVMLVVAKPALDPDSIEIVEAAGS